MDAATRRQSENRCRPESSILRGNDSWDASFIAYICRQYDHLLILAGAKSDSINSTMCCGLQCIKMTRFK